MIADHETNVVFVADTLEPRFPEVFQGLQRILHDHGIPLRIIPGTREVWCRDYMPIQVAEDRFVQFRFAPDYLTGKYRHLRADGEIGPTLAWVKNCVNSNIVLDGGNLVKWTDKVIMTEKVITENPEWDRRKLLAALERLLEIDRVILIPSEPGDVTGHADGVVRFVDATHVVVNNYRGVDPEYRRVVHRRLKVAKLESTEIAFWFSRSSARRMPSAIGNYVNYLQLRKVLILPSYRASKDPEATNVLKCSFPELVIYNLEISRLAEEGGGLHCVSWNLLDMMLAAR
jgi:agmatine deiminase